MIRSISALNHLYDKIKTYLVEVLFQNSTMSVKKSKPCQFLRVSSDDNIEAFYDIVPENKEYLMRLKAGGDELVSLAYTLKEGKSLPYNVRLAGGCFNYY